MIYSVLNFFLFWMKFTSTSDCARNRLRSKIQSHIKMILYQPKRHQRYLNVGNFFYLTHDDWTTQNTTFSSDSPKQVWTIIDDHQTPYGVLWSASRSEKVILLVIVVTIDWNIYGQFWEYILQNDTPVL